MPKPTYSAHWIAHTGLRRAVARFLEDERPAIEAEMAGLAEESPFRRSDVQD
jgi:predicted N-acyltransferase